MEATENQYIGSLLGLALGDALGAEYEGGVIGTIFWKVMTVGSEKLRWTDDTEMAMGLSDSLIHNQGLNADHLAGVWASRMQTWRGYGPGARKILSRIAKGEKWSEARFKVFPNGSFGNGGAMRAAPIGLFYHQDARGLDQAAILSTSITHAHPLGIEGGRLIARAVDLSLSPKTTPASLLRDLKEFCRKPEFRMKLTEAEALLKDESSSLLDIVTRLGNSVLALDSAVTAIYAFCRFPDDFSAMITFIINLGGDTDTIGAMAGGIFGAKNGAAALPAELIDRIEARSELEELGRTLFSKRSRSRSSL